MRLTPDQIQTIQDALEFAYSARLDDFDNDKDCCEVEALHRAVRAARDAKRFSKVLYSIRQQLELVS
jgi:hypothetical protein